MVVWSDRAVAELRALFLRLGGPRTRLAYFVTDRVFGAAEQSLQQPELGRVVPEYRDPRYRELLVEGPRIQYRAHEDAHIEVAVVWDSRKPLRIG